MATASFNYNAVHKGIIYEYSLTIIADLASLSDCPICGAPDCGDDQYIWAEFNNEKQAIHFGGGTFGAYLGRWHYEGITEAEYKKLPAFMREYNEGIGWNKFEMPCSKIDPVDFKQSLEVIKQAAETTGNDDFSLHYYPLMTAFVDRVILENKALYILE